MRDSTRFSTRGQAACGQRRAVIYTRVSSKEQLRGGFSIPAQRKLLTDYARERGLSVAAEFSDVETAGRAGRAEFGAMIAHLRQRGGCTASLVEKTDRLYRNIKDWVSLGELGVEVHLVKEGVVLTDDSVSSEKLVHGIKVLMAKNYLDNLSEETRKGLLEKARQGLWPSHAPLGYRNVTRADGKRIIERDPEAGPLVTKLFGLYATGDYPLTRLTEEAKHVGLVYRKSRKPLPRAQIHAVLRNPIYMGEFNWKGVRYRGSHEPLVSRDVWESVQDTLTGRAPRRRTRRHHQFAFSGLIQCGVCWDEGKRHRLVAERQKERYVYYRCEECKRRGRATFVREESLVEAYLGALAMLPLSADTRAAALRAVGLGGEGTGTEQQAELARLHAEHADLQARLDLAYDDRLAGRIDSTYFDRRAEQWRARLVQLRDAIEQHDAEAHTTEEQAALELKELIEIFRETTNPSDRRRVIQSLHSNSIWRPGKLHVEWRQQADITRDFDLTA